MSEDSTFPAGAPILEPMPGTRAASSHPFVPFSRDDVERSIPARFETQVATHGQRTAVGAAGETLTYTALDAAANQVAHAVLERRGGEAEPVALLLEQGTTAIVAILGALKAGKAYVPLDPAYPVTRIGQILQDVEPPLVITEGRHLRVARELGLDGPGLLTLDALDPARPAHDPGLGLAPDRLACVLYTSGSTGRPKGVMISHRAVLHEVLRTTNELHLTPDDRQTLLRSVGFGGALRDIFSALLNGASLHSLNLGHEGTERLAPWLAEEGITVYRSVVSVFRQFVRTLRDAARFPRLRIVHVGGEPMTWADVEAFRRHFPETCRLLNGLGITETGTARHFFIDHRTPITMGPVPVGYAVPDVEVLLLDEEGRPVGTGEPGEIAIRSRYLSPGYWRQPELNQMKFLPDPDGGGARIYLTGDLGRMLPDDCLIHQGRKDFQVKVRGHRVELSEVERTLLALSAVKEAVVVAREDQPGEQRLVAYLVPASRPGPTASSLRHALAATLPGYMIPAAFVLLDEMPLTALGKVDRAALPIPGSARPAVQQPYVAPRSPMEESLARIWAEVLSLAEVGVHDPFLELGGDSLLATRIASRVLTTFRVELPLRVLFEAPTVATMAEAIATHPPRTASEHPGRG